MTLTEELALIAKAKAGCHDATNALYEQYRYLLLLKCKETKYRASHLGFDDLKQIAAMAFLLAIRKYDETRLKKFSSYLTQTVKNHLYSEVGEASIIRVSRTTRYYHKNMVYQDKEKKRKTQKAIQAALGLRVSTKVVMRATTEKNPTFNEIVAREERGQYKIVVAEMMEESITELRGLLENVKMCAYARKRIAQVLKRMERLSQYNSEVDQGEDDGGDRRTNAGVL